MQIIVNTCVRQSTGIVMIRKPRRGWWYLPGGKVDPTETWPQAALREVREETGLIPSGVILRGVYLITSRLPDGSFRDERVIVQFEATGVSGTMVTESKEGPVDCIAFDTIDTLPMNEGDRMMLQTTYKMDAYVPPVFGKFTYDEHENLLQWHFDNTAEMTKKPSQG